jgi:hypothetical protein
MGIAGVKPRQLAATVGMTGSESTGSPAPSSSSTMSTRSHLTPHRQRRDPIYDEFIILMASRAPPLAIHSSTSNPPSRMSKSSRSPSIILLFQSARKSHQVRETVRFQNRCWRRRCLRPSPSILFNVVPIRSKADYKN